MKEVQELVGIVPWTFVAQICNLFLTVFLVKKFLFDRINKVVEERKQMADSQIADATKAKEEAKTMRDQGSGREKADGRLPDRRCDKGQGRGEDDARSIRGKHFKRKG